MSNIGGMEVQLNHVVDHVVKKKMVIEFIDVTMENEFGNILAP